MNVLCLDGPLRGKVTNVTGSTFQAIESPRINYLDFHMSEYEKRQVNFHTITYHVHRFVFLGKEIMVASRYARQPDDSKMISLVLSPKARSAIRE